jgi:gliding motility-associated-like protein
LYIAAKQNTCVQIHIPGFNYSTQRTIFKDSVANIKLPYSDLWYQDSVFNRAILINASAPITLFQANNIGKGGGSASVDARNAYQVESSVVMPDMLNDFFYGFTINAYREYSLLKATGGYFIQFVGRQPNVISIKSPVNYIIPPIPTVTHPYDSTFFINMVNNSAITLLSTFAYYRYFNTSNIRLANASDLKMLMFSFGIPYSSGTSPLVGMQMWEELKPPTSTSSSFHVLPIKKNFGNTYSFMAVKDSTVLYYNGVAATVLDSLERHDTCITGPMHITASHPVLGFLGPCPDWNYNNNSGSPFIVTLSGDDELITESLFRTMDEPDSLNHYVLGVVTRTNAIANFLLNGQPVTSNSFTPFASDPAWSWANIELNPGTYKAQSDSGFHAFQYTWYHDTDKPINYAFPSYGYNLPQSITWPQDSFVFRASLDSNNLQPFGQTTPTLCPGQPLYVQASHLRHTTWQWAFGDGATQTQRVGDQRAKPINYTWQSPGQYWVTIADSAGCTAGDSLLVIVKDGPQAAFSYTANAGCSGTFVQLQNQSVGATSYNWQWPGGSSTAQNPSFVYTGPDTIITVSLIATDGICTDTTTQILILNPSTIIPQQVPNVITPNNDGVNDALCIPNTAGYQECYQLEIFNRWGTRVFATQNPQECWEPSNIAAGVYFYVLTLGQQRVQGEVTMF